MKLVAHLLSLVIAMGMSLALTPWMGATAVRIGLVDRPDGRLKKQEASVPYLGGLAFFIAFLMGFAPFHSLGSQSLAILLGGNLVLLLGLLDDMGRLPPLTKLLGQSLAILVVLKAGVAIKIIYLPPWVAYPLSFLWLLGLTNAFNLIDIMDGLSAGVGAVACVFLFPLAYAAHQEGVALMALSMLGALLGFLRYNSYPARIYMGDTGSLFLGFTLGALTMVGQYARTNQVALLAPILILGVPIFDTLFVMSIRWMRGANPLKGSPDHYPLRLRKWRLSVRQTVWLSYLSAFLLGIAALVMVFGSQSAAVGVLGVVSVAVLGLALLLKRIDMTLSSWRGDRET